MMLYYDGEWMCDFCCGTWAGAEPQQVNKRDWCGSCDTSKGPVPKQTELELK